jgi:hypothetical protein
MERIKAPRREGLGVSGTEGWRLMLTAYYSLITEERVACQQTSR